MNTRIDQGLRDLIAKGENDPKVKSAMITKVVHKIEIYPDGFEIHFQKRPGIRVQEA